MSQQPWLFNGRGWSWYKWNYGEEAIRLWLEMSISAYKYPNLDNLKLHSYFPFEVGADGLK